ncbi:hypothetical protein GQ53DRAFT_631110, partial [Thozetella sp. PMI_491]
PTVKVPSFICCSGQIGEGDIKEATARDILPQRWRIAFHASQATVRILVKFNVYLVGMKDFAPMSDAYVDFLPQLMPARSCLQAVAPGEGTLIEIEYIAQP